MIYGPAKCAGSGEGGEVRQTGGGDASTAAAANSFP